ncbi:MAG: hypothetical protein IJI68_04600, partial [Eggerthellaceae bacterium]|nr:hypothetical protein [Eggerthellaceae bacterium]
MARQKAKAYRSNGLVEAADAARGETSAADVASTVRTDAVTAGLVHGGDRYAGTARSNGKAAKAASQTRRGKARDGSADAVEGREAGGAAGIGAEADGGGKQAVKTEMQRSLHLKAAVADAAVEELDDSDELEGVSDLHRGGSALARATASKRASQTADGPEQPASPEGDPKHAGTSGNAGGKRNRARSLGAEPRSGNLKSTDGPARGSAGRKAASKRARKDAKAEAAKTRIQSRRTWIAARAAQAEQAQAAAATAGPARKAGVAKAL